MPINVKKITERLKKARTLQSLSVESVSRDTGVLVERLLDIENGAEEISGDEILILADYYRHDFRDFVEEGRPSPFDETEILYRRNGTDFTPQDRRSIQEFLFLCEIESELEKQLDSQKTEFRYAAKGSYFKGHGENAADALRKFLNHKENEVPMDVFLDFRKIGVHIFRRRLSSSDISGLYLKHPLAGHCILVNYDDDVYRQRFSVSHEVAHAIFDSSEAVSVSYNRTSSKYDNKDMREIRANRFASCYLLPPNLLPSNVIWDKSSARDWANKLKVSTSALSYALFDAKKVDKQTAERIRSFRVLSTAKADPEAPQKLTKLQLSRRKEMLERGLSNYYVNLCFEAYKNNIISFGRLSEALLAEHGSLREISILYGVSIQHEL